MAAAIQHSQSALELVPEHPGAIAFLREAQVCRVMANRAHLMALFLFVGNHVQDFNGGHRSSAAWFACCVPFL